MEADAIMSFQFYLGTMELCSRNIRCGPICPHQLNAFLSGLIILRLASIPLRAAQALAENGTLRQSDYWRNAPCDATSVSSRRNLDFSSMVSHWTRQTWWIASAQSQGIYVRLVGHVQHKGGGDPPGPKPISLSGSGRVFGFIVREQLECDGLRAKAATNMRTCINKWQRYLNRRLALDDIAILVAWVWIYAGWCRYAFGERSGVMVFTWVPLIRMIKMISDMLTGFHRTTCYMF